METLNFKTQTNFIKRKNPSVDNAWGIALDIGYSSVKGFSPNLVYSFPSYAKLVTGSRINSSSKDEEEDSSDILYRNDDTGEIWAVGESAQKLVSPNDTNDSEIALFGRNRYFSPMFKVIVETSLGIGLMSNEFGSPNPNQEIYVQTGLPPKYMTSDNHAGDTEFLKEVISGKHHFSLMIGKSGKWSEFNLSLPEKHVNVIPQPMGTLISISTNKQGVQVPEAKDYFNSKMLIFDPGFGTLDIFDIINGRVPENGYETFNNLGMKQVFKKTCADISRTFNTKISILALQNYLAKGQIVEYDRAARKSSFKDFSDILYKNNEIVCNDALNEIDSIRQLDEYKYFVITGGTGSGAWLDIIKEAYSGLETLNIIDGSQNDNLPCIFANVRGYYMFLHSSLNARKK